MQYPRVEVTTLGKNGKVTEIYENSTMRIILLDLARRAVSENITDIVVANLKRGA